MRATFTKGGMAAVTRVRRRKGRGRVLTPELQQKILDTTPKTRPGKNQFWRHHFRRRSSKAHERVVAHTVISAGRNRSLVLNQQLIYPLVDETVCYLQSGVWLTEAMIP